MCTSMAFETWKIWRHWQASTNLSGATLPTYWQLPLIEMVAIFFKFIASNRVNQIRTVYNYKIIFVEISVSMIENKIDIFLMFLFSSFSLCQIK